MAYVFKLPPTVTDQIMRFAIGYPSDRIKDMMARVERIELQADSDSDIVEQSIKWSEFTGPSHNCEIVLVRSNIAFLSNG